LQQSLGGLAQTFQEQNRQKQEKQRFNQEQQRLGQQAQALEQYRTSELGLQQTKAQQEEEYRRQMLGLKGREVNVKEQQANKEKQGKIVWKSGGVEHTVNSTEEFAQQIQQFPADKNEGGKYFLTMTGTDKDGNKFSWPVEIDPNDPDARKKAQAALSMFKDTFSPVGKPPASDDATVHYKIPGAEATPETPGYTPGFFGKLLGRQATPTIPGTPAIPEMEVTRKVPTGQLGQATPFSMGAAPPPAVPLPSSGVSPQQMQDLQAGLGPVAQPQPAPTEAPTTPPADDVSGFKVVSQPTAEQPQAAESPKTGIASLDAAVQKELQTMQAEQETSKFKQAAEADKPIYTQIRSLGSELQRVLNLQPWEVSGRTPEYFKAIRAKELLGQISQLRSQLGQSFE